MEFDLPLSNIFRGLWYGKTTVCLCVIYCKMFMIYLSLPRPLQPISGGARGGGGLRGGAVALGGHL